MNEEPKKRDHAAHQEMLRRHREEREAARERHRKGWHKIRNAPNVLV